MGYEYTLEQLVNIVDDTGINETTLRDMYDSIGNILYNYRDNSVDKFSFEIFSKFKHIIDKMYTFIRQNHNLVDRFESYNISATYALYNLSHIVEMNLCEDNKLGKELSDRISHKTSIGESFELNGFGKFTKVKLDSRKGVTTDGKEINIPSKVTVKYTVDPLLEHLLSTRYHKNIIKEEK